MQAIITKFHGPTDFKGSRITASTESGIRKTIGCADALRSEDNHKAAAIALCQKMNWTGRLVMGGIKGGYVFVFDTEYGTHAIKAKATSEDVVIIGGSE